MAVHALLLQHLAPGLARVELVVAHQLDVAADAGGEAELALAHRPRGLLAQRDVERARAARRQLDDLRIGGEAGLLHRDLVAAGEEIDGLVAAAAGPHHEQHVLVDVQQMDLRGLERLRRLHGARQRGAAGDRPGVGPERKDGKESEGGGEHHAESHGLLL